KSACLPDAPADLRCPGLGGDEDQVAGGVLHVGVDTAVDTQGREGSLQAGVGGGRLRMSAQVIAKEERVPLVWPSCHAEVHVHRSTGAGLKEELAPVIVRAGRAGRSMVLPDVLIDEASARQRRCEARTLQ